MSDNAHVTVLLEETVEGLVLNLDDVVVDGTLGGAGHAHAIAQQLSEQGMLIGFDADTAAIERSQKRLKEAHPAVHLVESNFRHLASELDNLGIQCIDKAVFDLGLSSNQLENAGRGFTFQHDEPLQMTFNADPSDDDVTAHTIVNEWSEESIADIIYGFGEDRYSRKIAKAIVEAREVRPIETTQELAQIVASAVPARGKRPGINPATKTFQALRMAVNDELGALEDVLKDAFERLAPQGRIAVISFHSLEDRIVKRFFKQQANNNAGTLITKKPIVPTDEEVARNPRSRSAKLRIIEKK